MLYAIFGEDVANSLERRLAARPQHLQRLQDLQDLGRLILAGPHPVTDGEDPGVAGFTGSLIVAEFEDLEQARHWAESDPYFTAGVFARITVKPFKQVFPQ